MANLEDKKPCYTKELEEGIVLFKDGDPRVPRHGQVSPGG